MKGKRIIVGITGGIAAYKVATVVREMKRRGAEVRVVMTPMAKQFITPLTMATLSQNPIAVDFFDPENGAWNSHVSLGLWADAYLIAPATANTLGKMANGIADNLLLTTYLSAKCPVFVAPSMDLDMYAHEATQNNISLLKQRGVQVIDAEEGFLASGLFVEIQAFYAKKSRPTATQPNGFLSLFYNVYHGFPLSLGKFNRTICSAPIMPYSRNDKIAFFY